MRTIDPKQIKIVKGIPPLAKKGDKISLDTEWFGMDKKRLHRPHGQFAFLGATYDGETVYYVTNEQEIDMFLGRMDAGVWIGHNLKFDITQLRRFTRIPQRKLMWDTMLVEQIMYSGYYNDFSLADLVRRRLDTYLPKAIRAEFSESVPTEPSDLENAYNQSGGHLGHEKSMSTEMLEYACVDVVATWQVYQSQRAEIDETDLNIWKDIELPFLWTIMAMGGVKLDTESWIRLAESNGKIAQDIQAKYGHTEFVVGKRSTKEVFVGLNLNSPAQVKAHLASLGYTKMKSTDAEALEEIADKCAFAKELLTYRTYAKRASTYGKKFIEDYVEPDGRIYGDIFQMGAETGRTSYRSPNLQNQPHESEYRSCFVADKGNCMVIADWGSQEPRIAAYLSQDERLIEILNSGKKLYIEIAKDVFHREITKEMEEYKHIKSTVLGIFYGMSAQGLAVRLGIDEGEADHMIKTILRTYPGIQEYIDEQSKAGDYVQSVYGRKIWLNKYNNQWQRNALNAPIQGSAADAMKIAAYRFYNETEAEHNWKIDLLVHDEIVLEVPEPDVDGAKQTLERVMIEVAEALHDGIKGSVEVFSGENWAAKH